MTNVGVAASKSFFLHGELLAKYREGCRGLVVTSVGVATSNEILSSQWTSGDVFFHGGLLAK